MFHKCLFKSMSPEIIISKIRFLDERMSNTKLSCFFYSATGSINYDDCWPNISQYTCEHLFCDMVQSGSRARGKMSDTKAGHKVDF